MSGRLPDLVPALPTPPARSRRGGRRVGAGAPKGNLNALKHGRRSRFKDALPLPPLDTAAVARRVLLQEQRDLERVAAAFVRVTLHARYRRECAEAVAAGRPLPVPSLASLSEADFPRLERYLKAVARRHARERERADGRLTPDDASVRDDLAFAAKVNLILPHVAELLDRNAQQSLTPGDLTAILERCAAPHDQTSNQAAPPPHEPVITPPSDIGESTPRRRKPNKQSNAAPPVAPRNLRTRRATTQAPSPILTSTRKPHTIREEHHEVRPCRQYAAEPL